MTDYPRLQLAMLRARLLRSSAQAGAWLVLLYLLVLVARSDRHPLEVIVDELLDSQERVAAALMDAQARHQGECLAQLIQAQEKLDLLLEGDG